MVLKKSDKHIESPKKKTAEYFNSKDYEKSFVNRLKDPTYKQQHRDYMLTKIDCIICGCKINRASKTLHNRSMKHLRNLKIYDYENENNDFSFDKNDLINNKKKELISIAYELINKYEMLQDKYDMLDDKYALLDKKYRKLKNKYNEQLSD